MFISRQFWVSRARDEQIECPEAFRGNTNGVKHPHNVTSHVSFPRNVSGENMTRRREVKKCPKNSQNERLLYTLSDSPRVRSTEYHGMPRKDMGGHWKGVMWLGTNMWMLLRSFRGNFGFYEKSTNGVFRGFSREHKWCQTPAQRHKSR